MAKQRARAPAAAPKHDCSPPVEAPADCAICPRLSQFIASQRINQPDWFNAPVPSFGTPNARLAIIGLAPGMRGANRTGRPFTGDYAGDLLYQTLLDFGFAKGQYDARPDDGLTLTDALIVNAVRCVPPANKPTAAEINNCRPFLLSRLNTLANLRAILVLGRIAHDSTLRGFGLKLKDFSFGHGRQHALPPVARAPFDDHPASPIAQGRIALFDSYHCSRYNTNTGRLTTDMFRNVFQAIRAHIADSA